VEDLLDFLKKRVGLLEAVVLSGGEATIHNLKEICEEIKSLGFKIKLDTNGSNPKQIKNLLDSNLLDYAAIDFKATKEKFNMITKSNLYENFLQSLNLLKNSKIEYEVRTTLHNDLLDVNDINQMQKILIENGYNKEYYIQNFLETENLSGIKESNLDFNKENLSNDLNIVWRN
jgi:pyruvate formate lyase activating enzyme